MINCKIVKLDTKVKFTALESNQRHIMILFNGKLCVTSSHQGIGKMLYRGKLAM